MLVPMCRARSAASMWDGLPALSGLKVGAGALGELGDRSQPCPY